LASDAAAVAARSLAVAAAAAAAVAEAEAVRVVEVSGLEDEYADFMGEFQEVQGQQVHSAPLFRRTAGATRYSLFKSSKTGKAAAFFAVIE
jgi:hypothetical protein